MKGLPRVFRLTTEGGPSAPPPLAPAMYAREHGLPPHLPWSGRDSGGVRGVAGAVPTAAVASSFWLYFDLWGCAHGAGRVVTVSPIHAVSWVNHTNDLDGHPRSCEVLVMCFGCILSFFTIIINLIN